MKRFLGMVFVTVVVAGLVVVPLGCVAPTPIPTEPEAKEPVVIHLTVGAGHPKAVASWIQVESEYVEIMEKRVAENTNYRLDITEAYATVVKLGEELEGTESGILDMCMCVSLFEPSKLLLQNYTGWLPFTSGDAYLVQKAVVKTQEAYPIILDMFEDKYNCKVLVERPGPSPVYDILSTFPVHSLADLKGRKVANAGPQIPLMEKGGMVGVQSGLTEAYTSLQTGVYDGWLTAPEYWYSFKLQDVTSYYCMTGAFGSQVTSYIIMNLDTYNSLPVEVRDIVKEVYQEFSDDYLKRIIARNDEILRDVQENYGITIIELPQADRVKWAEAAKYMARDKAREMDAAGLPGTDVMRAYVNNLKAEGHIFPVDPVLD